MGKQLNLETFNEILFSAFKEQTPEAEYELYALEIQSAYAMKIEHMERVIADLNEERPYHEDLKLVNNIDSNLDILDKKLSALIEKHPELRKSNEQGT